MSMRMVAAAAVLGVLTVSPAAALPGLTDSYAGNYDVHSAQTGSHMHSFWLPNLLGGPGSRNYWQFDAAGGAFGYDGTNASLTGRIVNNVETNAFFDVNVDLSFTQKGGRTPKCEFGSACGSSGYQTKSDQFEYFSLGSATLTGAGDLAGLVLALTMYPANGQYPPQLGFGANNKDIDAFGLSAWFSWVVTRNTQNLSLGTSAHGDINIALSPVPLPAALPLMLAALGGLGLVARRRRTAG